MSDVFKMINATKEAACRTAEANAIREKTGGTAPLTYDFDNGKGFAEEIASIQTGITPTGSIEITENGTYDVTEYASADVNVSGGGILPSGYTQYEYLESSGTQYIDTGTWVKQNTKLEIDGNMLQGNPNYYPICGTLQAGCNSCMRVTTLTGNSDYFGFGNHEPETPTISVYGLSRCIAAIDAHGYYVGGYKVFTINATVSVDTSCHIMLFACGATNNQVVRKGNHRIYYYKQWEDGVLIRHMIPAMRDADSVLGMYDVVNDVFYTNAGTGTFSGGALT